MNSIFTCLKKWLAVICLIAAFSFSEATIVYHDEDPDVTQTQTVDGTQAFDIDMDNDATVDFVITIFKGDTTVNAISGNGSAVTIEPNSGNFTSEGNSSPVSQVAAYNSGDNINSSLTWQSSISLLRFSGTIIVPGIVYGNFTGSVDKYIGVKFSIGANTHYGWIRIAVSDAGDSYTVKDWAYEDTPDTDIDAGAMPVTSVNKQLTSTTSIVNINNMIEISFADQLSGTVNAMNMSGAIIGSVKFNGSSCIVNMQNKPSGVYSLIFETTSGAFSKKVFVK